MNLRRIEAFLAVAETRNISRAATQLEVAQSVVSRSPFKVFAPLPA